MRGGPIKFDTLGELRALIQRYLEAHDNNDVETQRAVLGALIEDEREAYKRKLELLAKLKILMERTRTAGQTRQRVSHLIEAFKFAANLRSIGYDELDDKETGDKATDAGIETAKALKAINPKGLSALVGLLDDLSVSVRGFAAVQLLDDIPERAIPVIQEVEETARGSAAGFAAHFGLLQYRSEREQKR